MEDISAVYEKLGTFYLGKEYDLERRALSDDLLLYDSKDLVTHAVIVGMTGSGKTGLGVGLLEEAAIDGIPALIVDPKGDLCNLLLQFPELRPEDFQPWIQADDAARQGMSPGDYAAREAEKWRKGLLDWNQPPQRIGRLSAGAEYTIFTPGSDAGVPLSILSSFAAPPEQVRADGDLMRDRVSSTITSLLALLGIDADPLRSREHILLTNLLAHLWNQGQDVDLGTLIRQIQNPPLTRVGVMDLDAFFPANDRFALSMTLNNLLAAPSFASWMQGEPLDIDRLLYTESGSPRHSIFHIAHLSDAERMFFVSLLLNQTLSWMRSRPGTTSLRALLYIDELFGYMPPVAEPPSKKPLLTLLKQARAFGVGIVLATQNPVDLDYKGLANTGTWFIGRLQTERDKNRVLDGLEGASAEAGGTFDRQAISTIISNLGQRVFLMHNVHEDRPAIFQTRWALSYLTGPMTRTQIRQLMQGRPATPRAEPAAVDTVAQPSSPAVASATADERPVLPPEIPQVFVPSSRSMGSGQRIYQPALLGSARVHFSDSRRGLAADESLLLLAEIPAGRHPVDWSSSRVLTLADDALGTVPESPCRFADVPSAAAQKDNYKAWKKSLADHLYRTRRFELLMSPNLGECSLPGETERDFRIRMGQRGREERDRQVEKLRQSYASKLRTLADRVRQAELAVDREAQEASSAKMDSMISFGTSLLGAVLGRKRLSSTNVGRAATAARGASRAAKQAEDVRRAEVRLSDYQDQLHELEAEIARETERIRDQYDPLLETLQTVQLKPRRADIDVRLVALAWVPSERVDQADAGR